MLAQKQIRQPLSAQQQPHPVAQPRGSRALSKTAAGGDTQLQNHSANEHSMEQSTNGFFFLFFVKARCTC
jgi:hypothetical protein